MRKIILIMGLSFISCGKGKEITRDFVITKHKSISSIKISNDISGEFMFTESCRYDIGYNQLSWNKLIGFNYGEIYNHHHQNSARSAWRYNKEKDIVQLGYYIRDGWEKIYGSISEIEINRWFYLEVKEVSDSMVMVRVNDGVYYHSKEAHENEFNYVLWPYFGGQIEAPHEVAIKCRKLKLR